MCQELARLARQHPEMTSKQQYPSLALILLNAIFTFCTDGSLPLPHGPFACTVCTTMTPVSSYTRKHAHILTFPMAHSDAQSILYSAQVITDPLSQRYDVIYAK